MLRSSYRINLIGGSYIKGEEFFEVEADRVVTKLKDPAAYPLLADPQH